MTRIESKCRYCKALQEEVYYLFCDVQCQDFYVLGVEMNMKSEKIDLPEALYKSWLEDETNKIVDMDLIQIEQRILALQTVMFEARTKLSITYQKKFKLLGSEWADNSKAISSPDFRVNYDSDQRTKREPRLKMTKEEKDASRTEAAGIDPVKLKEIIKRKMLERAKKPMVPSTTPVVKEEKVEESSKTAVSPILMMADDDDFD